jgi:hypothetical protein
MKTVALLGAVILVSAAIGLAERPGAPASRAPAGPGATVTERSPTSEDEAAAGAGSTISGEVREVIDVAEYTYVRLASGDADTWAAVRKAPLRAGQKIVISNATRMDAFSSATLGRTFDVIYFGELSGAERLGETRGALPPGHPPLAGGSPRPLDHGAASAGAKGVARTVERASGENGRSVAELYADRSRLSGKRLRVRGQIVKATPGVLGKNYYRLRDGSSTDPEKSELVVTTRATPNVDDLVTFEGDLRTDVDVGIGFVYPLLLEDAVLSSEP